MDFRGFDPSIILILRGGIPRPTGIFTESLSQAILAGIVLAGGLGVSVVDEVGGRPRSGAFRITCVGGGADLS